MRIFVDDMYGEHINGLAFLDIPEFYWYSAIAYGDFRDAPNKVARFVNDYRLQGNTHYEL